MIQQTALGELVKGLSIRQAKCQGQAHVLTCIKHYTQTKILKHRSLWLQAQDDLGEERINIWDKNFS